MLRGLAASMVVLGHAAAQTPALTGFAGKLHIFNYPFGVDLFFVISGFIMTYTTERDFGSAHGRARFVSSRITRIVPTYWLLTTAAIAIGTLVPTIFDGPPPGIATILGSYCFVPIAGARPYPLPVLVVGWTLDYEMMFYALFALSMFLPRRQGIAALIAALIVLAIAGTAIRPSSPTLAFWTDPVILEFALGIAIALAGTRHGALSLRGARALMALGVLLYVGLHFVPGIAEVPRIIANGLPAAAIVAGAAGCDLRNRPVSIVPLVLLGDVSYSLYLSHLPIVKVARFGWNLLGLPPAIPAFCLAAYAVAVIAALAIAFAFELPLHRAARRWIRKRASRRLPNEPVRDIA